MRAIVKEKKATGLTLAEMPAPKVGPGDVLIRVKRVGLCGTDLHIYHWNAWAERRIHPPLVIGHEFAGVVEDVGSMVTGFTPGEKVTAEGHIACGACFQCRTGLGHICRKVKIIGVDVHGAFADLIAMPAGNVWKIDPQISLDVAALHDPLGNAFHTVMSSDVRGKRVLVLGSGPIGLFCVAIARASGAARVIASEIAPGRRAMAAKMGAHRTIDPTAESVPDVVREETEGAGADVVLEMSGNPQAIRQALKAARDGADVSLLGLPGEEVPIDVTNDVIFKGITLRGIVGRRMYDTWYQMRSFLLAGLIDPTVVITHRFAMIEVESAMQAIAGGAGKVLFNLEEMPR
ncbi:MAG: L-threonine 3-dehydrogenase [Acidobacteria bacterium]|nr:L-threonine 3-dehydrogenase [Acidobacteriota bacterium]